jgi:hypothetical protein
MLPRLVDGVEHREQPGQRAGYGLLLDGCPVPVDALAVVGVLGLQALQVRGALRQLRVGIGLLLTGGSGGRVLEDSLENLVRGVGHVSLLLAVLRLIVPDPLGPGRSGGAGRPAGTRGAGRLGFGVPAPDLTGHRIDAPVIVDDRA